MTKEEKITALKSQEVYQGNGHSAQSLTLYQYMVGNLARNPAIVNIAPDISARRIATKITEVADALIEKMVKDYD